MFQDKSILEIIQDPEGKFQFITDCFRTGHLSVLWRLLVNGSFICVLYSVLFFKKNQITTTLSLVNCEIEVSRFELSVSKPKTRSWIRPITKDTDSPANQSKLEVMTCSWRKARENECEPVTIGFASTSDWSRKWREIFKPITKHTNLRPVQTCSQNGSNCKSESHVSRYLHLPSVLITFLSIFSRYSSRQAAIIYNLFYIWTNHVTGKKQTTIVKPISKQPQFWPIWAN